MEQKDIIKLLENRDIKPTIHRVIILDYLIKSKSHPTAETIYSNIKQDFPTISLATVYNALELFEQHSLVRSIKFQNHNCRFDYAQKDHLHIYISNKNEIVDIYDANLIKLIEEKLGTYNFQNFELENISIEIKQIKKNEEKS